MKERWDLMKVRKMGLKEEGVEGEGPTRAVCGEMPLRRGMGWTALTSRSGIAGISSVPAHRGSKLG